MDLISFMDGPYVYSKYAFSFNFKIMGVLMSNCSAARHSGHLLPSEKILSITVQSCTQGNVCISTPGKYLKNGYFLVISNSWMSYCAVAVQRDMAVTCCLLKKSCQSHDEGFY